MAEQSFHKARVEEKEGLFIHRAFFSTPFIALFIQQMLTHPPPLVLGKIVKKLSWPPCVGTVWLGRKALILLVTIQCDQCCNSRQKLGPEQVHSGMQLMQESKGHKGQRGGRF